MKNNIFEGAKFGDKFLTRDGKIAIFQYMDSSLAHLFTESDEIESYLCDGCVDSRFFNSSNDIVSRYQEPIDEDLIIKFKADWNINDDLIKSKEE